MKHIQLLFWSLFILKGNAFAEAILTTEQKDPPLVSTIKPIKVSELYPKYYFL